LHPFRSNEVSRDILDQQTVSGMEPSNQEQTGVTDHSPAPRLGVKLMITILIGLVLVAIYANIQKVRRDKIESVTIIPAATATPTAGTTVP